jgi:coatomer subunit beta
MATSTASWTLVHQEDSTDHASDMQSLRNALEKGNEDMKTQTMQKILVIMLNGDPLPGLLMHVIRFVYPMSTLSLTVGYAQ